ncbi:4-phosphoerythronate dehydrogenase [Aquicella lusitana]|uniref:Erythronate-4-phosphate dehydrogenase n=1 Tax=Aquicella lusitana TaxID=254246 RepID=A0A370GYA6_9COXI|nr:4-phosphoerythronate dehydrogenase [Aquicella lusitana]RDI48637.1 erythronate-4-phosphate dehydrogenase [Aquicella lusitana]VVC73986.1 Erythronate-4-phosphate dehydrogenase [Aquicella lusitana]
MKIVADAHIPYVKDYFGSYGELVLKPGRAITHDDVKQADILLVRSITPVNKHLLAGSRVKLVGSITAGADHLDVNWLNESGIAWGVAAGFNAPPVADYVVSVIAALQRRGMLLRQQPRAAVIGVGNVGRLVVERLRLLNFEVTLCDPFRAAEEPDFISAPIESLADVDLISLHVPLTRTGPYPTYHLIDQSFLARQKTGCILLNASRGAVVDTKAVIQHGAHLHGCYDVWEHEPNIDKAMLETALIATPHIAGYSIQSKIRGIEMIYRLACEKKIIAPQSIPPFIMPQQQLAFAGEKHHWQDIVLGIFNPLIMTAMMRSRLLPSEDEGRLFDEMRNQFNYRHEFAYTKIVGTQLVSEDISILRRLGIEC